MISLRLTYLFILISFASSTWQDELTQFIRQVTKCYDVIGLSTSVVYNDTVVYSNGFGVRDMSRGLPVDSDTLFGIGNFVPTIIDFYLI